MWSWGRRQYYTGGSFEPKYDKMQWPINDELVESMRWMRSAIPKIWPYVLIALVVGLVSSGIPRSFIEKQEPYPFSAFSGIFGFMLVFRCALTAQ